MQSMRGWKYLPIMFHRLLPGTGRLREEEHNLHRHLHTCIGNPVPIRLLVGEVSIEVQVPVVAEGAEEAEGQRGAGQDRHTLHGREQERRVLPTATQQLAAGQRLAA